MSSTFIKSSTRHCAQPEVLTDPGAQSPASSEPGVMVHTTQNLKTWRAEKGRAVVQIHSYLHCKFKAGLAEHRTLCRREKKREKCSPTAPGEHRLRTQHPLARLTDKDGQYRDWQRCEKMSTSSASASEHKVRDTLENSLGDFKSFI